MVQADTPIIDVHRHCLPNSLFPQIGRFGQAVLQLAAGRRDTSTYSTVTVKGITSILYPELKDLETQIRTQDQVGITKSLLSLSMLLEVLHLPASWAAPRLNDATAAMVARYPAKLDFLAMVSPFDGASIAECERCFKEHGAKGISIGTSWKGVFLDSPRADPFWEYAQDKGAAVFVHPPLVPIGYQHMNRYKLEEMVGRPFDTAMTVSSMILSGLFDRYPRLKIVLPHMGGGLPSVIGRLDFGYRLGYEGLPSGQAARCQRPPSSYLKTNLYVDTMGFSPTGIQQSIALFGADRVLFGTDYAAVPISPKEHIDIIKGLGLSAEDESRILWKNANDLFRLM